MPRSYSHVFQTHPAILHKGGGPNYYRFLESEIIMTIRKQIARVIHCVGQLLIVIEELLLIDMDYDQLLIYLKMFKEFVKEKSNASGKT